MKTLILLGVGVLFQALVIAQSQGPRSGTSFNTDAIPGSTLSWNSPSNATTNDNTYSNFGDLPSVGNYTDYLVATDFGFTIPTTATIAGILVEVECADPNGVTSDYSVRIVKGKSIGSGERATGSLFPATDTYISYGSSTDLWGESWIPDDINDGGFGIAISAERKNAGGSTDGMIDDIRITVFYNFGTLPLKLVKFNAYKKEGAVELQWITTEETDMSHFEIERSTNGREFGYIASTPCLNQNAHTSYSIVDNNPASGLSYYRLKMIGIWGEIKYSSVVAVQFVKNGNASIYPNPWLRGTPLYINNPKEEKLLVYFFNAAGKYLGYATTNNMIVPEANLSKFSGLVHYQVYTGKIELVGTGSVLIK